MLKRALFLVCICSWFPLQSIAQVTFHFDEVNLDIPDNNGTGVSDVRTISTSLEKISDLNVQLNIGARGDGAFNGDIYATLLHGSGYSVLLNRVGRREGNTFGYSDSGMNITLDDEAEKGDVHVYRLEETGNHSIPLESSLNGTWAPDGRQVDPTESLISTERTAFLDSFDGLDPNGDWTLFLADQTSGGTARLESWALEITSVPEPSTYGVIMGLGLVGVAVWRRWRS
jgi:subtilisin-like proprotein convertase family protein